MKSKITIDGKEYVLKDKVKIEHKKIENMFNANQYSALLKELSEFLSPADDPLSDEEVLNLTEVSAMDPANVILCYAKTERAKILLKHFIESENVNSKIPSLDYYKANGSPISAKYSLDYLLAFMKFFEKYNKILKEDSNPRLSLNKDYPLLIENEDFGFLLAPRLDDDE